MLYRREVTIWNVEERKNGEHTSKKSEKMNLKEKAM
jgi:hypothetical protein